jgi:hypothetical protein
MSHRINLEEAKQKREHELEVQSRLKGGSYKSKRFELRRKRREDHETSWFSYIKARGGIKEKEKKPEKEPEVA